jgi:diguanylate cyclase (GGDEF)-like protein
VQERSALHRLLADTSNTNIVIRSDARGFIECATSTIAEIGFDLSSLLFGPHIRDLGHASHAEAIEAAHRAALTGQGQSPSLEFPGPGDDRASNWYEVRMRGLSDARGRGYGVLSVLRCVTERKSLEERLFAARLTDPLTRLTNRIAFTAMLEHLVARGQQGCLALFDLDHFMALNMRHGQAAGDEMLCAFASLLRCHMRQSDIVSRVGAERFAVLLCGLDPAGAVQLCQPVIETLAAMNGRTTNERLLITASGGIAAIAHSLDRTMKCAELALFTAKALGRSRVETARLDHLPQ